MLNTDELLAALKRAGVRNVDIARALGLTETRASEIRRGKRRLTYDEGAKLIETFKLLERPIVTPLTIPTARLAVLHLLNSLGVEASEDEVAELAADLKAFSAFVADPQVQDALERAEGFLEGIRHRKRALEETASTPHLRSTQ